MLAKQEAISTAEAYMVANRVQLGECVNALEFPDGSMTLHFSKPIEVSVPQGWIIESTTPQVIVVVVNRHDGTVHLSWTL